MPTVFIHSVGTISAGQTRYMGHEDVTGSEGRVDMPWPASNITALRVALTAAPGAGHTVVFTLRKNGADTGATVTVADAATTGSWSGTVSFAAGDLLSIKAVGSASLATTPRLALSLVYALTGAGAGTPDVTGLTWTTHGSLAASSTTYMGQEESTTEADVAIPCAQAGTVQNLRAYVGTAPGAGETAAFTLMKNGGAVALTCTISDTSQVSSDLVNTVAVVAGDTLSFRAVYSGGAATSKASVSFEIDE